MSGLILILAVVVLYLFLVFPAKASEEDKKLFVHRNFAHRGLYDNEHGVPENSLLAFRKAMEAGYGCELDVQFTKDKQLIVFHDNDYLRSCGVDAKVWDLTLEEARQLSLFGTEERIPTFREVLEEVHGQNPLIVEIKAEELDWPWYEELCEATWKELQNYTGDYCIESFHPGVVRWVWKHVPQKVRGLLVGGPGKEGEPHKLLLDAIAEMLVNFYCRPQFIAYKHDCRNLALRIAQKLGAFTVMWTVKTPEDQRILEEKEDCIIFEKYLPRTRFEAKGE